MGVDFPTQLLKSRVCSTGFLHDVILYVGGSETDTWMKMDGKFVDVGMWSYRPGIQDLCSYHWQSRPDPCDPSIQKKCENCKKKKIPPHCRKCRKNTKQNPHCTNGKDKKNAKNADAVFLLSLQCFSCPSPPEREPMLKGSLPRIERGAVKARSRVGPWVGLRRCDVSISVVAPAREVKARVM